MSEITYDDKVDLNVESTIANINKVTASDMNEIKSVVNANANTLNEINVPSNWVKVGDTIPTDGRKVLFKASKNLLDMSQVQIGKAWNGDTNSARAVVYMKCYPNTNYTISYNNISTFDGMYWVEKTNATDTNTTYGPSQITDTRTITTKATSHYIVIQFAKTSISLNDFNGVNIQIEQGSSATTYEPYIEQDLIVNGGKFIADQLVSVSATNPNDGRRVWFSKSKNLFDNSKIDGLYPYQSTYSVSNGVVTVTSNSSSGVSFCYIVPTLNLKANQLYGISFNVSGDYLRASMYDVTNQTYTQLTTTIENGRAKATFTPSNNSTYRFLVYVALNKSCEVSKVQIQAGSVTDYEPYVDQGIYIDNEQMYDKEQINEIQGTLELWGCKELGLKSTGYNADNCLPGQAFSWSVGQTITNVPSGVTGGRIYCFKGYGNAGKFQLCFDYPNNVSRIYFRNYFGSWGGWKYISLTAL